MIDLRDPTGLGQLQSSEQPTVIIRHLAEKTAVGPAPREERRGGTIQAALSAAVLRGLLDRISELAVGPTGQLPTDEELATMLHQTVEGLIPTDREALIGVAAAALTLAQSAPEVDPERADAADLPWDER